MSRIMEMYIISSPEKIGMPASKFATLKQIDRKHLGIGKAKVAVNLLAK
jgi:hypothetical protein